ncbi:MAG: ArtI [Herbinix sp.]|jgi:hypothetical protein|nr:ArtI [Herbinix sp.]
MKIVGTNMHMSRGDSESIAVMFRDSDGNHIPLVTGDTIYFTVKKSILDTEKKLQKIITTFIDGKAIVQIDPIDTKNLPYGKYVYDVQLTKSSGNVTTLITPSDFVICGEVTYE